MALVHGMEKLTQRDIKFPIFTNKSIELDDHKDFL